jgi:hypothetical protein
LLFWGGRGKEKLWVQILHRLSIANLPNGITSAHSTYVFNLFRCGYLQHRMWPKATKSALNSPTSPIANGKLFILLLILLLIISALAPSQNYVCKGYANFLLMRYAAASGLVSVSREVFGIERTV